MDKAEQPFQAEGLQVPSYVALGNHDGLVQGNAAANRSFEDVATGCIKPVAASQQFNSLQSAIQNLSPALLNQILQNDPTKVALVPPDSNRQFVSTAQYKALTRRCSVAQYSTPSRFYNSRTLAHALGR